MNTSDFLIVENAKASLGIRPVLDGVDLHVRSGEVVALFGHNGAGKSTLLRCIMGITPLQSGSISLGFTRWRRDSRYLVLAGVRFLPQNEKLFPNLTVGENLRVFGDAVRIPSQAFSESYAELAKQFPILREARNLRAGGLSGGEAQQVALARAFLGQPKLLLLDEPSIGLAPLVRKRVFATVKAAADRFGAAVVLVEHRVRDALEIADRAYGLRQGSIVMSAETRDLVAQPDLLKAIVM
jgi:branched-chain amino acid transport system ATP-binding protein